MFNTVSERTMHAVRWLIAVGWLGLIASLFYDPISPWLTDPNHLWSPVRAKPEVCIQVQGACVEQPVHGLGAPIFWGIVIPTAVMILLVFGHELWRRICPLSFLSQIPRALGWQRKVQRSGKGRPEVARVAKDSWLGRNYPYVQMGWFFIGLCTRILFINSNRLFLASWLLLTILAAIAVGYLYGGKSWCNYFCPMGPVQKIYAEPKALLASQAHTSDAKITQSMCRVIGEDKQEKSACVACQSPCIDIDSERTHWEGVSNQTHKLLYYGYVGLVVGYFVYYYLYAGNWDYYLSGVWAFEPNQVGKLLAPGFYLNGQQIPIPKLIAVPLTLGAFTVLGYFLGYLAERYFHRRYDQLLGSEVVQNRIYAICTFFIFNFFFLFAGRNWINLLPVPVQHSWDVFLLLVSSLWLYQTWKRSPELYTRESLANRLRKQLAKLDLNVGQFLDGKSLAQLNTDEVYVLAKVLPSFTREKRLQAYKGVLKEALEEGYVNTASSLEVLAQMRSQLDISEDEHQQVLTALGVEDPDLLNPARRRSLENSVRLNGYRRALERMLKLQRRQSIDELVQGNLQDIRRLRQEYCITYEEEEEILRGLDKGASALHRAQYLLSHLRELIRRNHALNQPRLIPQKNILSLLRATVRQKQRLLIRGLLELLEELEDAKIAARIAQDLTDLAPEGLQEILGNSVSRWRHRLSPDLVGLLSQPGEGAPYCALDLDEQEIADHLQALLMESNPITQAVSLYMLYQVTPERAKRQVHQVLSDRASLHPLVQETAEKLAKQGISQPKLTDFITLEKLMYLFNTDFFGNTHTDTLLELAEYAQFKQYRANEVISDEEDTCRELLLLVEGSVQVQSPNEEGEIQASNLLPGELLDELEVLSHNRMCGRIIAEVTPTRILAIPVDVFDNLLDRDHSFAQRVLELESRRLQQLTNIL